MAAPRSVVHVVGNSVIGGAERHVRDVAGAMRLRGLDVEVICPRPGPLTEALAADGVPVRWREFVFPLPNDEYALDPDALAWLTAYLRERRPDVVHSHLYPAHLHATLAAREVGVPAIVHTAHTLVVRTGDALLARLGGATTIATARSVAERLVRGGVPAGQVRVVYNGVGREHLDAPSDAGDAVRASLGLGDRAVILVVARLSREKGIDVLLDAMAAVIAARADATLVVAGRGPERERLETLAAARGVAQAVRFLGARDDVAALYRACDVVALPSREEACSLALLEAMAAAAPIVATSVGGTPELVRDGLDASLVPPDDDGALADAIVTLLADRPRARSLGASARRRARSRFTLDATVRDTIALYGELLAGATSQPTAR